MGEVFCDYFQLSFPSHEGDALLLRFLNFDDGLVLKKEYQETSNKGVSALYKQQNGSGAIKIVPIGKVVTIGVSGGILGTLRANGQLGAFLYNLTTSGHTSVGHVVTRLDATYDLHTDVNGYIKRLYKQIRQTGVQLTRKALPPHAFKVRLGNSYVDPSHEDTGTIYMERSNAARVRLTIYDKSNQMAEVFSQVIPPTIRYEMGLSREVGMNCKDICDPSRVFWHHMDPRLLPIPSGVLPWDNEYRSSYTLPSPDKPSPAVLPIQRYEGLNLAKTVSNDIRKGYYTIEDATNAFTYVLRKHLQGNDQ